MSWLNLVSLVGCVALCALAWLLGGCRRPFPSRTVVGAGSLLLALGMAVFWLPPMRVVLLLLNRLVLALLDAAGAGALYLFGPLALAPGRSTPGGEPSVGFVLATQVLPAVVFFASLMAALYHVGALQPVVRVLGRLFHRTLGLSGAEALAGSANVFFGVESAAAVRPYLERMTRSELLTLLTCGMSTVASTTLAIYVLFLRDPFPGIAGHLISASLLSVPAAALMAKLILPETGDPETRGDVPAVAPGERHGNVMAALAAGAMEGLKLAAGIATLLIAVLGLVAVVDLALARGSGALLGAEPPLDLSRLLGWLFTPLAWLLGIDPAEVPAAASLLGERIIRTEVVAYQDLAGLASDATISTRTMVILSYALCGFAHVASMGIFVGGFAALAPARRDDLAALGPRALLGATLATLLTGALAGLFFAGQSGLLGG